MNFKKVNLYVIFAALILVFGAAKLSLAYKNQVKLHTQPAGSFEDVKSLPNAEPLSPAVEVDPAFNLESAVLLQKTLVKNMPASGVPILMYHHVGDLPTNPDAIRKDLTVSTKDFSAELDYLKSAGYQTVTTKDLYLATQGKFVLPKKPIAITFDDGYQDVFDNAVPALAQRGMVGSFGIITQYAGQPDYANWQTIALAQSRGMEMVSHSQHHIDFTFPKYKVTDKSAEISGSMADLKTNLGGTASSNIFIYPYGHHDPITESLLQKSGYVLAFTTAFGRMRNGQDMLAVPRVRVHGVETLQRFIDILSGVQGKKISISR